jgi:hypothetical protein
MEVLMRHTANPGLLVVAASALTVLLSACSGAASSGGSADSLSTSGTSSQLSGAASGLSKDPGTTLPARWWKWAASFPDATNPVMDATGKQCDEKQPADIWFLAGSFGQGPVTRECTIPSGRQVYFPILNQACMARSRDDARAEMSACTLPLDADSATLDDAPLQAHVDTSRGVFAMDPVSGSRVFGVSPLGYVATGSWVGPIDLPVGEHLLRINGKSGSLTVDVTYRLTIGTKT